MGDHDDAAALLVGQPSQDVHDDPGVFSVQVAGGFVRQEYGSAAAKAAGDGYPLLFAAGEGRGKTLVLSLLDSYLHQGFRCSDPGLVLRDALHLHGKADVFPHGQEGQEAEGLEDDADYSAVRQSEEAGLRENRRKVLILYFIRKVASQNVISLFTN